MKSDNLLTLRVTAVVYIESEAAREEARRIMQTLARDMNLKLLLLCDALPGVNVAEKQGSGTFRTYSLSGDDMSQWTMESVDP